MSNEMYYLDSSGKKRDDWIWAELLDDPSMIIGDAAPRPLYVRRDVLNADEVLRWAKAQGISPTLAADDLHVTIAYSRQPLDWMKVGQAWQSKMELPEGGPRVMEQFGEALVLSFASDELQWRHESIRNAGASWDHPQFQPHITIGYGTGKSPEEIEPYRGRIVLGPEIFEDIDEGWKDNVVGDSDQPRVPAGSPAGGQFASSKSPGGFGSGLKGKVEFGEGDNPLPRSDLNVYAAVGKKRFTQKWDRAFKEEVLDVKTLKTRQTTLDKAETNLSPIKDPASLPPIKVARVNGENIVLDGNHRAASLFLQGHSKVKADVIDLDDPKNASLIDRNKLED